MVTGLVVPLDSCENLLTDSISQALSSIESAEQNDGTCCCGNMLTATFHLARLASKQAGYIILLLFLIYLF